MTNYEIHIIENTATNQAYVKYHYENRKGVSLRETHMWALNELSKGSSKDYVDFVAKSDYNDLQLIIKPVVGSDVSDAKRAKVDVMNKIEQQYGLQVINPKRG